MVRILVLALTLGVLGCAEAGRWGCRAEFGPSARLSCYGEETLLRLGPLEVAAGLDARYDPALGLLATPYTLLAYFAEGLWVTLEVGVQAPTAAWRVAVGAGGRW